MAINKVFPLYLLIISIAFLSSGCIDNLESNYTPPQYLSSIVQAYDYSDSHFIVDTLYKSSFLDYSNNINLSQATLDNQIQTNLPDFEIWVQTEITEPAKRMAFAITMLGERPAAGYPDTIHNFVPGLIYFAYFRKLDSSEYIINSYTGLVSFKYSIPDNYNAGIIYSTKNGKHFGKGSYGALNTDTLFLKAFKVANQSPDATPLAWELKMKNIYRLSVNNLNSQFQLDINYQHDTIISSFIPTNSTILITMLGLDRYQGNSRTPPPDGRFDWLPGITVYPSTGDIIFPSLHPFCDDIPDPDFKFCELYTLRKSDAQNLPKASYYFIKGFKQIKK
jgi:hypothetical protein